MKKQGSNLIINLNNQTKRINEFPQQSNDFGCLINVIIYETAFRIKQIQIQIQMVQYLINQKLRIDSFIRLNKYQNIIFFPKNYILKLNFLMNVQHNRLYNANLSPLKISKNIRISESTAHSSQSVTIKKDYCFLNLDRKIEIGAQSEEYIHLQKQIGLKTKTKLIDWLMSICWNYKIGNESLFLCVYLLQLYLKKKTIDKKMFQGLALTCLFIANKYNRSSKLKLKDFLQMCKNIYNADQILNLEQQILKLVDYDLQVPSINKYYQSLLWSLTEEMNNDQRVKIQFWLQIMLLKGNNQRKKTSTIFLQILNMVTNKIILKYRTNEMQELINFAKNLQYKTVIHKFMSKFDVQNYLNEFS